MCVSSIVYNIFSVRRIRCSLFLFNICVYAMKTAFVLTVFFSSIRIYASLLKITLKICRINISFLISISMSLSLLHILKFHSWIISIEISHLWCPIKGSGGIKTKSICLRSIPNDIIKLNDTKLNMNLNSVVCLCLRLLCFYVNSALARSFE